MDTPEVKEVCLIVPCLNEGPGLDGFLARVDAVAADMPGYAFRYVFIDDGSTDDTWARLEKLAAARPMVTAVRLSRNFGHQRALVAGLDFCEGDYAVILDADLQDPPEVIPQMIARLEEGFDVVHTVRTDRSSDTVFKRVSARFMYWFLQRWVLPELPRDAGLFKAFNRQALEAVRQYRERVRFLRGIFATLGFRQTHLTYTREPRRTGRSKYDLRRMGRLARDAVVSNSNLPLRAGFYVGCAVVALFPAYVVVAAARIAMGSNASVLAWFTAGLVWLLGGLGLVMLGAIGEYLKCIILETKQRPLYIVEEVRNPRRD